MADLPSRLAYLEELLQELNRVPPEDIHEGNDFIAAAVHRVLAERVKGLDVIESRERLRQDGAALARWLETGGTKSAGAAYIHGYLTVVQSTGLPATLEQSRDHARIHFVPPTGFNEVGSQYGRRFKKGDLDIILTPLDKTAFLAQSAPPPPPGALARLRAAFPALPDFDHAQVSRGLAKGQRVIARSRTTGNVAIDYVLEVPGGYVRVTVLGVTSTPQQEEIESQLESLAIS